MSKKKHSVLHRDGTPMPLNHQISKLFWIISPAFTRWAESHLNAKDLTPQRVRVLVPLIENGPMKMSDLKDELGVSATNITVLIDALEKDKMVTRRPHETDRRVTLIAITPKAEKRMQENYNGFCDRVGEVFSGLTKAKEEQLLSLLFEVRDALIERHVLEACDLQCTTAKKIDN